MTPEFGAASQLEKIEMLDYADVVAINKSDRKGAQDALRDVRKQVQRNRGAFSETPDQMPVYTTMAARFNDSGVSALYQAIKASLTEQDLSAGPGLLGQARNAVQDPESLPGDRERYLSEVADSVRRYHERVADLETLARHRQHLKTSINLLVD